jgi:hypothetical protein
MPFRPHWSVLCDFDGTIGLLDTIDTLLHRFGQPGWKPLEEDWLAGRMGSGECMRRQVALLDMDADEFADTCPRSTSTPPFPPSPQQWRAAGHWKSSATGWTSQSASCWPAAR